MVNVNKLHVRKILKNVVYVKKIKIVVKLVMLVIF